MKKNSVIIAILSILLLSVPSYIFSEGSSGTSPKERIVRIDDEMYRCMPDKTIPLSYTFPICTKQSAVKKSYTGKVVAKPEPPKPTQKELDQKSMKADDFVYKYEKKNLIFLGPGVNFMYSNGTGRLITVPTMELGYLRKLTPLFSLGGAVEGQYAFYGKVPHRSYNAIGGKILFGFNF